MEEREPFFQFVGDAQGFYQRLENPGEVMGLLAQLLHIADNNQIDNETVFELPSEDDILKIVYGPPFTIVFRNLLNGTLVVYSIFPYGPH